MTPRANAAVYAFTDRAVTALRRAMLRRFEALRGVLPMDELNILSRVRTLYRELDEEARGVFLRIARREYPEADGDWIQKRLTAYDPVTGYSYVHETERKAARLGEAMAAAVSAGMATSKAVDEALRLWSNMVTQYAIEITDEARRAAMEEDGVTNVEWISREDGRRCKICKDRHGKIYPIRKVPPKPHIGCRCYLIPARKEDGSA